MALVEQLVAAKQHLTNVSKPASLKIYDVRRAARRVRAEKFMQQFQCSAEHWDVSELMCWFQPKRGFPPNCAPGDAEFITWCVDTRELYGEDLRSGNEDLDPHVKFLAWNSAMRWPCEMVFNIKVGLDHEDAMTHGIEIQMAHRHLVTLGTSTPCAKTLARLGWVESEAVLDKSPRWYNNFSTAGIRWPLPRSETARPTLPQQPRKRRRDVDDEDDKDDKRAKKEDEEFARCLGVAQTLHRAQGSFVRLEGPAAT